MVPILFALRELCTKQNWHLLLSEHTLLKLIWDYFGKCRPTRILVHVNCTNDVTYAARALRYTKHRGETVPRNYCKSHIFSVPLCLENLAFLTKTLNCKEANILYIYIRCTYLVTL